MRTAETPVRRFRVADELWSAASELAASQGTTVSAVLRDLLADYTAGNLPGYTSGFVAGAAAARAADSVPQA